MTCKHWRELDSDNGCFEYCRAKGKACGCSGVLTQCNYRDYFNIPIGRIKKQKELDSINRTTAQVEPYLTK